MRNVGYFTGILSAVDRVDTSRNGNPRYRATLIVGERETVTADTGVDSSLGYSIGNHLGKRVTLGIGEHRGRPTIDSIESD